MRITIKDLEACVTLINTKLNLPQTTWVKTKSGPKSNIGNYHLSECYGGVALHRVANESGGVDDIFGSHMPKRELYNRMQAYIRGLSEVRS